ncbi:hypothetical protein F6X40_27845 [Paraburkholderia sp. UCT31]|uniref:hypothetical protein n=1 Tax=Paraburkholderia sp. UCT31 TaxID=2615209 RepID=UPI00165514A3|nr:hypothetical protein [Paraburkholderia sp. UCT31]MBC8740453.1 hypothetical protein [Paraburkholderia sp. UCT31]
MAKNLITTGSACTLEHRSIEGSGAPADKLTREDAKRLPLSILYGSTGVDRFGRFADTAQSSTSRSMNCLRASLAACAALFMLSANAFGQVPDFKGAPCLNGVCLGATLADTSTKTAWTFPPHESLTQGPDAYRMLPAVLEPQKSEIAAAGVAQPTDGDGLLVDKGAFPSLRRARFCGLQRFTLGFALGAGGQGAATFAPMADASGYVTLRVEAVTARWPRNLPAPERTSRQQGFASQFGRYADGRDAGYLATLDNGYALGISLQLRSRAAAEQSANAVFARSKECGAARDKVFVELR